MVEWQQKQIIHTVQIDSYCQVPSNSEKALLIAVSNQPVSVGIDPSTREFRFYSSGIFNAYFIVLLLLVMVQILMVLKIGWWKIHGEVNGEKKDI